MKTKTLFISIVVLLAVLLSACGPAVMPATLTVLPSVSAAQVPTPGNVVSAQPGVRAAADVAVALADFGVLGGLRRLLAGLLRTRPFQKERRAPQEVDA